MPILIQLRALRTRSALCKKTSKVTTRNQDKNKRQRKHVSKNSSSTTVRSWSKSTLRSRSWLKAVNSTSGFGRCSLKRWNCSSLSKLTSARALKSTQPTTSAITLSTWPTMPSRKTPPTTDSLKAATNCHSSPWASTCLKKRSTRSGLK